MSLRLASRDHVVRCRRSTAVDIVFCCVIRFDHTYPVTTFTCAMAKKKKKDVDFKKTKLKVGKVQKSGNLTKPTFKTSKVTLKEALDLRVDPVKSLSISNASSGSSVKILRLNRLLESEQLKQVPLLTRDLVNAIARMIIDNDKRVRSLAIKCLKVVLSTLGSSNVDVNSTVSLILSHVRCALTHLDASIADDGRKILLMLHEFSCVSSIQEQMLTILLAKLTYGMNDTVVSARSLDELQVLYKILSKDSNTGCSNEKSSSNNKDKQQQQQQQQQQQRRRQLQQQEHQEHQLHQQEKCIKWCERQCIPRRWLFPTLICNFSLDSLDSSFKLQARTGTSEATIGKPVRSQLTFVIEKMLHSYLKVQGTVTLSPMHGQHMLMLLRLRQLLTKNPLLLPYSLPAIEVIADDVDLAFADVSTSATTGSSSSTSSFGQKKAKLLNKQAGVQQRGGYKLQNAMPSNQADHLQQQLLKLLLDQTPKEGKTSLLLPMDKRRGGKKKQVTFGEIDADANKSSKTASQSDLR